MSACTDVSRVAGTYHRSKGGPAAPTSASTESGDLSAEQLKSVAPAHPAQPVVAEARAARGPRAGGRTGRAGSGSPTPAAPGRRARRRDSWSRGNAAISSKKSVNAMVVSRCTRSKSSASRQEAVVLGGAEVRDHGGQPRVPLHQGPHRAGTGVVVPDRSAARVHDDRRAGLGEHAPGVVEQRVEQVEVPDLHVHLEHLGAGGDRLGDVPGDALLGVEGRGRQALGDGGGEVGGPVVEVRRDARAVRVGQRREPAYAERAELPTRSSSSPR